MPLPAHENTGFSAYISRDTQALSPLRWVTLLTTLFPFDRQIIMYADGVLILVSLSSVMSVVYVFGFCFKCGELCQNKVRFNET